MYQSKLGCAAPSRPPQIAKPTQVVHDLNQVEGGPKANAKLETRNNP
jgi:hypothetical protein